MGQARHQGQAVGDAVVHLAQQHLGPVAGGAGLFLGPLLGAAQPMGLDRLLHGLGQQLAERAVDVLPDIVDRACLQRRHGDPAVLRPGDVDDRRGIGQGQDLRQQVEPGLARHVVVQRDDVDAALQDAGDAGRAIVCMLEGEPARLQRALHEAREARVVVDVEQAWSVGHGQSISGTCITAKNRPSCRIALANAS